MGNRLRPRVLLADEVGLGKTIEAGMILQNQLFAEKIRRVLIIVPENLQHQWLVEMLRRFNLPFALFDEERAADFAATEDSPETNPFESEALIICSLDWLTAYPKRAAQALAAGFDCLVVDEAHHLAWSGFATICIGGTFGSGYSKRIIAYCNAGTIGRRKPFCTFTFA